MKKILNDKKKLKKNIKTSVMLEKDLPEYLENDLIKLKEALKKDKCSILDCLVNELQGSVNSAFVDGDITEEQCDYLYDKYIRIPLP